MSQGMLMGWFILQAIIVIVVVWIGWKSYNRRHKGTKGSDGTGKAPDGKNSFLSEPWTNTGDVYTDPSDGRKYQIWFNTQTGERRYVPEES